MPTTIEARSHCPICEWSLEVKLSRPRPDDEEPQDEFREATKAARRAAAAGLYDHLSLEHHLERG